MAEEFTLTRKNLPEERDAPNYETAPLNASGAWALLLVSAITSRRSDQSLEFVALFDAQGCQQFGNRLAATLAPAFNLGRPGVGQAYLDDAFVVGTSRFGDPSGKFEALTRRCRGTLGDSESLGNLTDGKFPPAPELMQHPRLLRRTSFSRME